jgi:uncharacterized protein with HEPN domain
MTTRSYKLYAKDILDSIEKIEEFIDGIDFDGFHEDDKTSSAVIRKLEIIGEAVKQLPAQIKDNYKGIPWKEMAGMRDKLIHWYFGVDYELVWNVITEEIPRLKSKLKKIFNEIDTVDTYIPEKDAPDD